MNCSTFKQHASLYVDRQLEPQVNQEFLFHLNSCSQCFEYVDEIRQTASLLQQLGPALPPADLSRDILTSLNAARACQPQPSFLQWLHNAVFYSRPQYISYATGFVLTCLLFTGILYSFRPQFRAQIDDAIVNTFTPATPAITDSMPSVQSSSALAALTTTAFQQTPTQDLFVVADVSREGQAKFIALVDGPKNVQLERNVAAALKRASFKPAMKGGRPVNTRMLLLIQTIDVRG